MILEVKFDEFLPEIIAAFCRQRESVSRLFPSTEPVGNSDEDALQA